MRFAFGVKLHWMAATAKPSADVQFKLDLYRQMVRMRSLEEALTKLSRDGQLRGSLHLAQGQEAVPAGACAALRRDDYLTCTYRGHGYVLAKGADLDAVVAEILGRSSGLNKGKGGKMHLMDPAVGLLGANGIVAGGIGTAVGAALASWMDGSDRVSMTVFGDGTINQGHAHEALNMAALWQLPVIFLCENNLFAEMTALSDSSRVTDLCARMASYGIPARRVDGNDAVAVYDAVSGAVAKARAGGGPSFIEAMTYRTCGHYQNDPGTSYRTADEVKDWEARSPILRMEKMLRNAGSKDLSRVRSEESAAVDAAVAKALAAPMPDPATLTEDMFR